MRNMKRKKIAVVLIVLTLSFIMALPIMAMEAITENGTHNREVVCVYGCIHSNDEIELECEKEEEKERSLYCYLWGHSFTAWTPYAWTWYSSSAFCYGGYYIGTRGRKCTVCGEFETSSIMEGEYHNWVRILDISGVWWGNYKCSRCGVKM